MYRTKLKFSALRDPSVHKMDVEGIEIALVKFGGRIYALKNMCPHQQHRLLHEGEIADGAVSCPMHGWTFDLATGAARTGQGKVRVFPVQIENDEVLVDVGS